MAKKTILTMSKAKALMRRQNLRPSTKAIKKLDSLGQCLIKTAAKNIKNKNRRVKNKQKSILEQDIVNAAKSGKCTE